MQNTEPVARGKIACQGYVKAPAFVYDRAGPKPLKGMKTPFILVCGMTKLEMTPLLLRAAGIITDRGGITSHAAILSREMEIPCIVGTENATQTIPNATKIILDARSLGAEGKVYIVDK